MEKKKLPKVKEVFEDLRGYRNYLKANFGHENKKGTEYDRLTYCGDVRLQVYEDGEWYLRTGLSDYDQDHRGSWGCSGITHWSTNEELREIAADLISQAEE